MDKNWKRKGPGLRDGEGRDLESQGGHYGSADHGHNLASQAGGSQCGSSILQARTIARSGGGRAIGTSGVNLYHSGRGQGAHITIGHSSGVFDHRGR